MIGVFVGFALGFKLTKLIVDEIQERIELKREKHNEPYIIRKQEKLNDIKAKVEETKKEIDKLCFDNAKNSIEKRIFINSVYKRMGDKPDFAQKILPLLNDINTYIFHEIDFATNQDKLYVEKDGQMFRLMENGKLIPVTEINPFLEK